MARLDKRTITKILNEVKVKGLTPEEEPKLLNELERIKYAYDRIMTCDLYFAEYDIKKKCFVLDLYEHAKYFIYKNVKWEHTSMKNTYDQNYLSFDLGVKYSWQKRDRNYRDDKDIYVFKEHFIKHYDFIYEGDKDESSILDYLSNYDEEFSKVAQIVYAKMIHDIFSDTLLAKYGYKFELRGILEENLYVDVADEFKDELNKLYNDTEATDVIESEIYQFLSNVAGNNIQYKERSLKAFLEMIEKYSNKYYIYELLDEIENDD